MIIGLSVTRILMCNSFQVDIILQLADERNWYTGIDSGNFFISTYNKLLFNWFISANMVLFMEPFRHNVSSISLSSIGFTYGEYQQYMETPVESLVQDRANLYAETLLEFNVDRYTLVGYCVGGFLALETAKILLENGKKVKLIMIDSRLCQHTISNQLLMEYAYGLSMELDMDNTPYSIKPVMLKEALEKILNGENRNIKNSELTKLSDEYAELGEVFTNLLDMTHEERIKALFNSKKQHNFNGEESTISMLNLLYDIYEHTFNAMMRYRPEGIYSGDITYINATEGIVNFYPDTNVATTWEDMVLGEFKIVNIYANHASIVGAEHSKEILPYIE